MTDTASIETNASTSGRWASTRFLWCNVVVLAVVLFGVLAFVDNGYSAHPDEGVYGAQVDALSHGSWWAERPAPDVDRDAFAVPLIDSTVQGDELIAYDRHAIYPSFLLPFYDAAGYTGMLIASVLGTLAAAVVGAHLARRLDPRYGVAALWLIGVGSPLLFDAYVVIAHSIVAAAAGLTFLGITNAIDDDRWRPLAYALPAAAVTVAFRTEGVIYVLALGAVVGLGALRPSTRTIHWPTALRGGLLGVTGAVTYVIDTRVAQAIGGSDGYGTNPSALVLSKRTGPVDAIWSSLLRPFNFSWAEANTRVPLVVTLLVVGALAARLMPRRTIFPVVASLGAAVFAVLAAAQRPAQLPVLINGLFPAFPILCVMVLLLGRAEFTNPLIRRVLLSSLVTSALLAVSIYDVGGASEWGGRFFHILLVPLVVVTVAVLDRVRSNLPVVEQRVALASLVVTSLAMSYIAVDWNAARRDYHEVVIGTTVRYAHSRFGDDRPLVIVDMLRSDGLSRIFWEQFGDMDVLFSGGRPHLNRLLHNAADAGRTEVVVVTEVSTELYAAMNKNALEDIGWGVIDSTASEGDYVRLVTLGPLRDD